MNADLKPGVNVTKLPFTNKHLKIFFQTLNPLKNLVHSFSTKFVKAKKNIPDLYRS